ncbi:hypothetical protein B0A49_10846 [Cryomyces minteri]|uniref:Uncharacterized protein n=1 Tax=Cryomyces minteri TaxID=331657 RepID=A0A4U0WHB8_9PEZI|nr:hypothetical protein B0A49_10846 [Cryomyces minteri]
MAKVLAKFERCERHDRLSPWLAFRTASGLDPVDTLASAVDFVLRQGAARVSPVSAAKNEAGINDPTRTHVPGASGDTPPSRQVISRLRSDRTPGDSSKPSSLLPNDSSNLRLSCRTLSAVVEFPVQASQASVEPKRGQN